MSTDTPRTDEYSKLVREGQCLESCDSWAHDEKCPVANGESLLAVFAGGLERELTACRAEAEQWKKKYYDVADAITRESSGVEDLCQQARNLRTALATAERERDQARRQTMMDTECIERIRTVGMAAEAELAAALATIAEMREACEDVADGAPDATDKAQFANYLLGVLSRNQPTKEAQ